MLAGDAGPAATAAVTAAARSVVRSSSISGDVYGLEAGARGAADAAKKRRSSLGAKMVAIVGLSQWSRSTLQLSQPEGGPKKLRSTIRRSTETGIAVEMRSRVTRQGSRDSTDGRAGRRAPRAPPEPSCPSRLSRPGSSSPRLPGNICLSVPVHYFSDTAPAPPSKQLWRLFPLLIFNF
uniref:Regulating synaptic membrane exocytosis 3 n=1 Tax=Nothoprocta perdicaria TaxID=30464 RepID=A0A8C6Z7T6_NOTPE